MVAKFILIVWTAFILWAFLDGIADTSRVYGGMEQIGGAALMVSAIIHFLVWLIVAIPTYMIGRLFQRERVSRQDL